MTLLELRVKELPKRGGWPKGIEKISQSPIDGELYLFKPCEILTGRGIYFFEVSDLCGIKVHKRQFEAAIAVQQPVWNGEGLPPVGVECEIRKIAEWMKVTISFISEVHTVFKTPGGTEDCQKTCNLQFRPLRTEADRKREEAIESLMSIVCSPSQSSAIVNKIYDAIAAGKIPGVELSK